MKPHPHAGEEWFEKLPTAELGLAAFFGAQYWLHGSVFAVLFALFHVAACCALIGYALEDRGTL